jgi:3-hydroxyisobutyrate dehydrogenase-like beta-hydroxyacid dehydrogenase
MEYTIGFFGLGAMGTPIASNLLKNNGKLFVYNRTKDKMGPLIDKGAIPLKSPSDAFQKCEIVFSMLANDQALQSMCMGPDGLLQNAREGCIHVSMSTISPKLGQTLEEAHAAKGVQYITATVFGRPDVAQQAKLAICLSGEGKAKERVKPLLNFIGSYVYDFGEKAELANAVKLSGNFLILNVVEALAEAFSFAQKSGIEPQDLLTFFTSTIFPSPVYKTYGNIISNQQFYPPGFKMNLGLKDIDLLLRAADHLKVPLPIAGILHDRLMTGMANGRENLDWSAIAMTQMEESAIYGPVIKAME